MTRGLIEGYGNVEFDPIDIGSNIYELYDVAIVDPDNNYEIVGEEHYLDEADYLIALRDTYGRVVLHEKEEARTCDVITGWELHECECNNHVAYVIDSEE